MENMWEVNLIFHTIILSECSSCNIHVIQIDTLIERVYLNIDDLDQ